MGYGLWLLEKVVWLNSVPFTKASIPYKQSPHVIEKFSILVQSHLSSSLSLSLCFSPLSLSGLATATGLGRVALVAIYAARRAKAAPPSGLVAPSTSGHGSAPGGDCELAPGEGGGRGSTGRWSRMRGTRFLGPVWAELAEGTGNDETSMVMEHCPIFL